MCRALRPVQGTCMRGVSSCRYSSRFPVPGMHSPALQTHSKLFAFADHFTLDASRSEFVTKVCPERASPRDGNARKRAGKRGANILFDETRIRSAIIIIIVHATCAGREGGKWKEKKNSLEVSEIPHLCHHSAPGTQGVKNRVAEQRYLPALVQRVSGHCYRIGQTWLRFISRLWCVSLQDSFRIC